MNLFYKKAAKHVLFGLLAIGVSGISAQTNPTPQNIPYTQDFSDLLHASTTYPAGWQGWKVSSAASTSYVTAAPTGDQALIANSSASNNSGGVHNYNGKIGELPSGSTNPAIALAIITTGVSNIHVNYDIMVIRNPYDGAANNRINEVTLQYRIGTSGSFTTLSGMEYQSGTTLQTGSGVTTPQNPQSKSVILPITCNNQSVVQIRWIVKDITGAGSRPSFAIDNVVVDYDVDNDNYVSALDCNDNDATVNPSAPEICNFLDDDCDGIVDDGIVYTLVYEDLDGDNYGAGLAANYCSFPGTGYSLDNTDCNDGDNTIYPSATEICNSIDDDCDGTPDNGLTFTVYYADSDNDGYGSDISGTTLACDGPPSGYAVSNDDCNNFDVTINPGATEVCNGLDDNCTGDVDEGLTFVTYYKDNDADGYGDALYGTVTTCDGAPENYVADNTDCEDFNSAINPGEIEVCNFIDDNCSGFYDEGLPLLVFYLDSDGDSYGSPFATLEACGPYSEVWVSDNTDCNDASNAAYPGATEICDGIDNNCDGNVDEGMVTATITPSGVVTTCKGVPQLFTANTGDGYTYQWYKNGNIIVGATSSTYSTTKPANYQVQVNTPEGCFALSEPTGLGVSPNPNANISAPNGLNMCAATVKLKASFGATYTYQWYVDGALIPGATNFTHFPAVTGDYYCTITNEFNCSRTTAVVSVINVCKEGTTVEPFESVVTLDVYPNPADNYVNLELAVDAIAEHAQITIVNILGEVVYSNTIPVTDGSVTTTIFTENFASGAYIIAAEVEGKIYSTNLMVNN